MESVHGISVSGGSFPAEIWRLFMEPALDGVEPRSFPEPDFWPEWQPFTRGQYALTYDPSHTAGDRGDRDDGDRRARSTENPPPVSESPKASCRAC